MDVNLFFLILRVIHILGGVFWVGAAFLLAGFIGPAVQATAPEGGKVMQHLLARTRYNQAMAWASSLTVLTGLLLLERVSGGFQGPWMASGTGMVLTVSGALGVVAYLHSLFTIARSNARMAQIARAVQATAGPPTEAQWDELGALQAKAARNGRITALMLLLVVIGMAAARVV